VEAILQRYPNLEEMVWVQEEPKNMGAWHYIAPILFELASGSLKVGYIGRPDRSSPAGGDPIVHKKEQERIVDQTLKIVSLVDTQNQEISLL
jgi:2-oxoglutarate dehydrogenase E1 component